VRGLIQPLKPIASVQRAPPELASLPRCSCYVLGFASDIGNGLGPGKVLPFAAGQFCTDFEMVNKGTPHSIL